MPKRAVSLTLEEDNLLWLKVQAAAGRRRSLSDAVDQIVTAARLSGQVAEGTIRSVINTVEINPADPNLDEADTYVAELFAASTQRPWLVRERPPEHAASAKERKKRGRG